MFRRTDSSPTAPHYPELDGLRAIAILAVLLFHCCQIPDAVWGGWPSQFCESLWCGVDLFFVLSGFLITGILLDTRNLHNRWSVFVARRTLRLFPLYYSWLILLFWIQPLFSFQPLPIANDVKPWCWTYTFNWYVWHLQDWPSTECLGPLWSLAVEEQFYLLWPLVVFAVPARRLGLVCLAGIGLAIVLKLWFFVKFGATWPALYTATPARMDALLGGGFVAWAIRFPEATRTLRVHRLSSAVAVSFLLWLFSQQQIYVGNIINPFTACYLTIFYALVFPWVLSFLVTRRASPFHRLLCWRPWGFIARLSYGMYLSHFLIWSVLTGVGRGWIRDLHEQTGVPSWILAFGIAISSTILVSWLLFALIERPFLKLKRCFPYRQLTEQPAISPQGVRDSLA